VRDTQLFQLALGINSAALAELDFSALQRVCIDETAAKRGHN
jgi:hypothetical protein